MEKQYVAMMSSSMESVGWVWASMIGMMSIDGSGHHDGDDFGGNHVDGDEGVAKE
jgi:hypothetical protein